MPGADTIGAGVEQDAIRLTGAPDDYDLQTEWQSHWFHARLPRQFDAVIHLDRTTAVEPLERNARWDAGEPPETYPTGL